MKTQLRKTANPAAVSALVNGVTARMMSLSEMSQMLAAGRVDGRMVRHYALMCAIEAIRATRLVEMYLVNDLQENSNSDENIGTFYTASPDELDGYASWLGHMGTGGPAKSSKNKRVKSTPDRLTTLDLAKSRPRRSASTR